MKRLKMEEKHAENVCCECTSSPCLTNDNITLQGDVTSIENTLT